LDVAQILPYLFAASIATLTAFFVSLFWELIKSKLFRPLQGSDYQKAYETYENSIRKTHEKFLKGPWRSVFLDQKFIENQFDRYHHVELQKYLLKHHTRVLEELGLILPYPFQGNLK